MKRATVRLVLASACTLLCAQAWAADPFELDIDVNDDDANVQMVGGNNFEDIINNLDEDKLRRDTDYTGVEIVDTELNFRGVRVSLDFPNAIGQLPGGDGTLLRFQIPALNITRDFQGATRDESIDLFEDFLKSNGGGIITQLYQLLAAESPIDPIAGNPASVQSHAVRGDFQRGFTHRVSQVWGCGTTASSEQVMLANAGYACQELFADLNPAALPEIEVAQSGDPGPGLYDDYYDRIRAQRGENQIGYGIGYSAVSAGDFDSTVLEVPLSYTWVNNDNPSKKLQLRIPIALVDTEGAESYQFGLGLSYAFPLRENWSLTPSVGYTVVGSEDLASGSALLSTSVTSSYTMRFGGWGMNIGNMLGLYQTQKLKIGDFESDADISNTVMTNGIMFTGPGSLLAKSLVLEYFINDTRFFGDDLYSERYDEIGVNLGKLWSDGTRVTSFLKGGLSYTTGERDVDVIRLSLAYKF